MHVPENGSYSLIQQTMKFYQQKLFRPYQRTLSPYQESRAREVSFQDSPSYNEHSSPQFNWTPDQDPGYSNHYRETCPLHSRDSQQPIWQQLYYNGMQSQRALQQLHLNHQNKLDIECTFHPLLTHSKRYLLSKSSTFIDRVSAWQEQKIQKIVKEKQEITNKGLMECTFTPRINSRLNFQGWEEAKNKTSRILGQGQTSRLRQRVDNPYYHPFKTGTTLKKCDTSRTQQKTMHNKGKIEIQKVKKLLRKELKKMDL